MLKAIQKAKEIKDWATKAENDGGGLMFGTIAATADEILTDLLDTARKEWELWKDVNKFITAPPNEPAAISKEYLIADGWQEIISGTFFKNGTYLIMTLAGTNTWHMSNSGHQVIASNLKDMYQVANGYEKAQKCEIDDTPFNNQD